MQSSVENAAYAFHELLELYEKNKTVLSIDSPFHFGEKLPFWIFTYSKLRNIDADIAEAVNVMVKSIEAMQESLKILSLGIDYKKYSKFKILTPEVMKRNEDFISHPSQFKKFTKENCQFCIEFVIACSIQLQEFDFEITHLIDAYPTWRS
jgi:hypothetical protein